MKKIKKYQKALLMFMLIVTAVTFYPVLNADFINYDDTVMITGNWKIKSLATDNLKAMFFDMHERLYHPLVSISYALEYHFFGEDPYFYHAVNLILHLLNVLLVFFIFFKLTKGNFPVSFITAFIFACHPLHVEAVAWVSARKDILYAFFFLCSILAYINSDKQKNILYLISLLMFAFSCLSKPAAVIFPIVLVLIDWFQGSKFQAKSFVKYAPFFLIALIFAFFTLNGYYLDSEKSTISHGALSANMMQAHFNILFYIFKFIYPAKLSIIYPNLASSLRIAAGIFVVYISLFACFISLKYTKKVTFAFLFFIITLLPMLSILPIGDAYVADRYVYIPLIGLCYLAAIIFVYAYKKIKNSGFKKIAAAILAVLMLTMCVVSHTRATDWKDSGTIFDSLIQNYQGKISLAYALRGVHYAENKGNIQIAEQDMDDALKINPFLPVALYYQGKFKMRRNDYEGALKSYKKYFESCFDEPNMLSAYLDIAAIYGQKNDEDKVHKVYNAALNKYGLSAYAKALIYNNLGVYYMNKLEYEKAISYITKAKEFNPEQEVSYLALGEIYKNKNEFNAAINEYIESIKRIGGRKESLLQLGSAYFDTGRYNEAFEIFLYMKKLFPEDYRIYDFLGNLHALKGDYKNAVIMYTKSLLINNNYSNAYFHRAAASFELKRYEKALKDALTAKKLGFELPADFIRMFAEKGLIL